MSDLPSGHPPRSAPTWRAPRLQHRKPFVPIWSAVPAQRFTFYLTTALYQAFTHWDHSLCRTLPCVGTGCRYCPDQSWRWKGYLGAVSQSSWPAKRWGLGKAIVEVTLEGLRGCPHLALPAELLAGRKLVLAREWNWQKAKVVCRLEDSTSTRPTIPADYLDVRDVLLRTWSTGPGAIDRAEIQRAWPLWQALPIEE